MATPSIYRASGQIAIGTFVTIDPANDFSVSQATSGSVPHGIAALAAEDVPQGSNSLNAADGAGDSLQVFTVGEQCRLLIGSGGVSPGDFIRSDNSGAGVKASSGQYYGAVAVQAASQGAYGRVYVVLGKV